MANAKQRKAKLRRARAHHTASKAAAAPTGERSGTDRQGGKDTATDTPRHGRRLLRRLRGDR